MARGVNKVIILGTLGKDPEIRYSTSGSAVCTLSLATNESWTDKATGERREHTEWHRVQLFGKQAEVASEYLKKGSQTYIEGKLKTEKYTDKEGVERYQTSIVANDMQFIGGRQDGGEPVAPRSEARAPASKGPARRAEPGRAPRSHSQDFDDEIPF